MEGTRKILKEYFSFTKKERNGVVFLLVIIVMLIISLNFGYLLKNEKLSDFADFEQEIDEFHQQTVNDGTSILGDDSVFNTSYSDDNSTQCLFFDPNLADSAILITVGLSKKQIQIIYNFRNKGGRFYKKEDLKNIYTISDELYNRIAPYIIIGGNSVVQKTEQQKFSNTRELFPFDPNNTSDEQWKLLGMNERQVSMLNNYLAKGGKFNKKEDFKKIYCISPEKYVELEAYINIPDEIVSDKNSVNENFQIEINSCDSANIIKLKGIGAYHAKNIIKYRSLLGGFVNKDQLLEVYHLKEETYMSIKDFISVDLSVVKKININTADVKQLGSHPYMDWQYAREIVHYRDKNGQFQKVDDILLNYLMPKAKFEKIMPYLSVN